MKNTFIKMLSVTMAMVIALGACAITVYAEDCAHENAKVISITEATCTEDGEKKLDCPDCGEVTITLPSCKSQYDGDYVQS